VSECQWSVFESDIFYGVLECAPWYFKKFLHIFLQILFMQCTSVPCLQHATRLWSCRKNNTFKNVYHI